ncbi:MATE family efflux transporter [Xylophilus sp. Leaf220]|uniref:MATE family efflux transporter n=1 Tax=Xylophilus sp. Leaf220 TaxID=1735686 RepID=UPI000B2A42F0|nr:MATE family efflux transporter [Xylophilus sp. Leaf220]
MATVLHWRSRAASVWGELPAIARHAGTVLAGQWAVMAFGVTDTVVAGRHSDAALAALAVGSAIFVSVYVALMGVVQALLPVWAELHGAHRYPAIGRSVRQSLYICGATSVAGMALLLSPAPLLQWADVPVALRSDVVRYLGVLALGLPAALLFRVYSTLNQSLGRPLLITWLQVGSLALKVPLTVWLTLGGGGMPALGVTGCAWATIVVHFLLLAIGLWLLRTQPLYRPYAFWKRMEAPDAVQLKAFARLGVPAGLAILVEITSFTLMALLIARQGTVAAASHQVASNLAAVLYMVPLSIAIATSARVGYWLGAGQAQRASAAVTAGLGTAGVTAVLLASMLWSARNVVAGLYTSVPAVAQTAAMLLGWVALYHCADALQSVSVFVLRCYRVTVKPLLVYCVLLWGVGTGGGYVLAYGGWHGLGPWPSPETFWITSAAALAVTAVLFLLIVRRAVRTAITLPAE